MRRFVFILFLLVSTASAYAGSGGGGWMKWLRQTVGSPATKTQVSRQVVEQSLKRQLIQVQGAGAVAAAVAWNPARALTVAPDFRVPSQNMAVFSSVAIPPETEEEIRFRRQNDRLAEEWRNVAKRDMAVMLRRKRDILQALQVSYQNTSVNYAALIPQEAKFIAVGEEHGFYALRHAFERIVLQYQQMYPERKIVVLTEFVFDRTLPFSEKTGEPVSLLALRFRRVSPDFRFLEKFIKRGIDVIGLEDERYFRSHQKLISPAFRQVESVYGMKKRNDHWRKIIAQVRQKYPEAVFFVYTGNMHVHYRAPFALVKASPQVFVMQLMSKDLGKDLPFGAVMQNEPFARAPINGGNPVVLSWPRNSPFNVLSGFDACLVFPETKNDAF